MKLTGLIPLTLLCASTTHANDMPHSTIARVRYTDLALDDPSGRAELRLRVADAAQRFCQIRGEDVTLYKFRKDPNDCPDRLRNSIVREMPGTVYRAYKRALREAGVKWRRL